MKLQESVESKMEFHNLYSTPGIISMIQTVRMRWAGHVARMEIRTAYEILFVKHEET
jgi:hypothetical protein